MRKLLTILAFIATILTASAHDVEVDGIFYNLSYSPTTATVTYKGGWYSDYSNEYIGSVTIPSSITVDGVTYSVTSIGSYAFRGCSGLTSIIIPNSVTSISDNAFGDCSGLTSITIPNSVRIIKNFAFDGCSGLTSITIPNSVTSIGYGAFRGCM